VPRDEPAWWYGTGQQAVALCLEPIARVYGAVAVARFKRATAYRSKLPVICIGNFTAGGTGKTPLAIHIAGRLKALGERPVFLTRGYGGNAKGPLWVESARHSAVETGDEPLLLVRSAPTMVARDRKAGALAIEAHSDLASVIIMDDGLQNPSLAKDLSIAVVDAKRGLGNGRVIPAGPLRAPLTFQVGLCDAIVMNGSEHAGAPDAQSARVEDTLNGVFAGPMLRARVAPDGDTAFMRDARLLAYAGIGNPQRFFDLLAGSKSLDCVTFRDHQALSEGDARSLLVKAQSAGATLITTEKDWVRLPAVSGPLAELKNKSRVLAVRTVLDEANEATLDQLLEGALATHRRA
jgi:tetraacyldisaccharide 4'-kinase